MENYEKNSTAKNTRGEIDTTDDGEIDIKRLRKYCESGDTRINYVKDLHYENEFPLSCFVVYFEDKPMPYFR